MHIRRYRIGNAPTAGELRLVLFFPVLPGGLTPAPECYFDAVHIDAISDDTGKELSEQDWATYLSGFRGPNGIETVVEYGEGAEARTGPTLGLRLALPDRRAEALGRI